tara:strand:+ start:2876 stop:3118 length:243 start_codon:yes stop_codon:yes gene_type:complete
MTLDKNEYLLKKKCIKIIENNDIQISINKIANIKFNNQKLGVKKAKRICKIYIEHSVDYCNKPDNFNYVKELNRNLAFTK